MKRRILDPWGHDHHGQIKPRCFILFDFKLNHGGAAVKRLNPMPQNPIPFHRDERFCSGEGVFNQISGSVAHRITVLFGNDFQAVVRVLIPYHLSFAHRPLENPAAVISAFGIFNDGRNAVGARILRGEGAGNGF